MSPCLPNGMANNPPRESFLRPQPDQTVLTAAIRPQPSRFSLPQVFCWNREESTRSSFAPDAQASIVHETGRATLLMLSTRLPGQLLPPFPVHTSTAFANTLRARRASSLYSQRRQRGFACLLTRNQEPPSRDLQHRRSGIRREHDSQALRNHQKASGRNKDKLDRDRAEEQGEQGR